MDLFISQKELAEPPRRSFGVSLNVPHDLSHDAGSYAEELDKWAFLAALRKNLLR